MLERPFGTLARVPPRWWGVAGVLVVAALVAWWLRPTPKPATPTVAYTACLLTDSHGLSGQAAAVWSAIQDATDTTHAQKQYRPVTGAQTAANALPVLHALVRSGCNVVFAVGTAPVAAVKVGAAQYPKTRFIVVGAPITGPNVSEIGGADYSLILAVNALIEAGVGEAGAGS
jgi:basic membrane lipoprotein Med (substrate-binding protein (PBP1-ABC) superfamily)